MEINSTEAVITHGGIPRSYKLCKCNNCGIVEKCTFSRDFYTTTDKNGPLLCQTCMWKNVALNLNKA
jgi:hypothetical protein